MYIWHSCVCFDQKVYTRNLLRNKKDNNICKILNYFDILQIENKKIIEKKESLHTYFYNNMCNQWIQHCLLLDNL